MDGREPDYSAAIKNSKQYLKAKCSIFCLTVTIYNTQSLVLSLKTTS